MDSHCHPWFTTTNLSYRFPIFESSATALCGTTGKDYSLYVQPLFSIFVKCFLILFISSFLISPFFPNSSQFFTFFEELFSSSLLCSSQLTSAILNSSQLFADLLRSSQLISPLLIFSQLFSAFRSSLQLFIALRSSSFLQRFAALRNSFQLFSALFFLILLNSSRLLTLLYIEIAFPVFFKLSGSIFQKAKLEIDYIVRKNVLHFIKVCSN